MFADLEEKLIIFAIVVAVLGGCIFSYWYRGKQIEALKTQVITEQVANDTLTTTVKVDTASAKINSSVNVKVNKDIAKVTTTHDSIIAKVDRNVWQIDTAFKADPTPKTPLSIDAEQKQVSSVLIAGVWEQYCSYNPTIAACQPSK